MAHWFHRNPLKATSPVSFDLRTAATNGETQKICRELREFRTRLLDIMSNPNNETSTLTTAYGNYVSLLHGFIESLDDEKSGDSKLRHAIKFRWTNTLCGNTPTEQQDCLFEKISILFNMAMWYTKHAAKIAGNEEPSMEEAKELHKCLRTAAGIFSYIKDQLVTRLIEQPEKGTDFDHRVLTTYINLCTAEAQEVTIARAIELKHSTSIVSSLAYETAKLFTSALDSLNSIEDKSTEKWKYYMYLKINIYYAYAYSFHGETLLAQDKCGEAIKCLEESTSYYEKAETAGKQYSSTKGPGTTAKPQEHIFFRKLGPVVKRTLDKCMRENGFIYHQKVPPQAPDLELKATYGLVAPEEHQPPGPSPSWTPAAYKAFDITAMPKEDPKKQKDGDLAPVKEKDIPQSNKDPNNFSGCVVS